jgi:hypothetical protein
VRAAWAATCQASSRGKRKCVENFPVPDHNMVWKIYVASSVVCSMKKKAHVEKCSGPYVGTKVESLHFQGFELTMYFFRPMLFT